MTLTSQAPTAWQIPYRKEVEMSDERSQRQAMMQEAIDGQLTEETARKLVEILGSDQAAAREYDQLQRVDSLLKRAPQQRAPARLAATIMARLAQRVQAETALSDLPAETQQIMMLCLSASMMAMMPMMEAASWLVLNARRDPELLSTVMIETIGWMTLVTDALIQLLEDAENRARSEPEIAAATLALTPYLLRTMLDYLDELPLMA
ncbi:MAG: hypothetical protein OXG84_08465 [Chloroflexi bacterium]|nr:hypothetical protein [Chloroflexota bacterium]